MFLIITAWEHLINLAPPTHLATRLINHIVILKTHSKPNYSTIYSCPSFLPFTLSTATPTIPSTLSHDTTTKPVSCLTAWLLPSSSFSSHFLFILTSIPMYHPIRPLLLIHSPTPLNSLMILVTMVLLFLSDLD